MPLDDASYADDLAMVIGVVADSCICLASLNECDLQKHFIKFKNKKVNNSTLYHLVHPTPLQATSAWVLKVLFGPGQPRDFLDASRSLLPITATKT